MSLLAPPPLDRPADWLAGLTLDALIAVAIGALAAAALRLWGLHWSWAVVALAVVLAVRAALAGETLLLAGACAWAAVGGRRRHRDELALGARPAAAAAAAARRTPLDALAWLVRHTRRRIRRSHRPPDGAGEIARDGRLAVGSDERGRTVWVPFGATQGSGRHTLVLGATGSGKTFTQARLLAAAIDAGSGAVVVDPKGDPVLREQLRRAARSAGRGVLEWSPAGPTVYNPLARGSETEIADKALAGERFTEPHYLRQAQRYLGHAIRALRAAGSEVSLAKLVEQLDPASLELLARSIPADAAAACHAYLDSLGPRQRGELAGVRDRLAVLAESDAGRWLDPASGGAPEVDLLAAARARAAVYFALDADRRPLLAEMLGAAVVQDLVTLVAELQASPTPTLVAIDEFSALAAAQVARLFARARSAGVSLLLGTQELSDLRPPGRERLLEQVLGNLSLLVAHRQAVPASAELLAGLAGRRDGWRIAHHSDGRRTRTQVREPAIDAGRVMSLEPGSALVVAMDAGVEACFARILFPPAVDRRPERRGLRRA
jgi:hypothetical protein